MGHICHTCKKELKWNMLKFTHHEVTANYTGGMKRVPPKDFTSDDRMCYDCAELLPKNKSFWKENSGKEFVYASTDEEINSEYNITVQKSPYADFTKEHEIVAYEFEISNCLVNGKAIKSTNTLALLSLYQFTYNFALMKTNKLRSGKKMHQFNADEFLTFKNMGDMGCSQSIPNTPQLDYSTGKLIIDDDKNDHYEIQLKFKSQIYLLDKFVSFINLRQDKINDETVKEIHLKNHSEKIMLEKNKTKLHKHEEIIEYFVNKEREPYHDWKTYNVITKYGKYTITNLRIINDMWVAPVFFVTHDLDDELPTNFTHDEYDDVIASNVRHTTSSTSIRTGGTDEISFHGIGVNQDTHTYQGTTTGNESGDIIFMSKGKKFHTWENFVDPKGIVEMIKSAKSQFESQDEKIPEPVISSSDDDPLKILKIRLAKGEITLEEFNEIKENLV
jgi:hypothetical protein